MKKVESIDVQREPMKKLPVIGSTFGFASERETMADTKRRVAGMRVWAESAHYRAVMGHTTFGEALHADPNIVAQDETQLPRFLPRKLLGAFRKLQSFFFYGWVA